MRDIYLRLNRPADPSTSARSQSPPRTRKTRASTTRPFPTRLLISLSRELVLARSPLFLALRLPLRGSCCASALHRFYLCFFFFFFFFFLFLFLFFFCRVSFALPLPSSSLSFSRRVRTRSQNALVRGRRWRFGLTNSGGAEETGRPFRAQGGSDRLDTTRGPESVCCV